MTAAQIRLFLSAFPFAFVALWLLITTALSLVSGWRALQDRYPARNEPPLLTLNAQSGSLGRANYNGCLTLKACPGGLRVSVWKLFAPFQRAIEVPWNAIAPDPPRGWLQERVTLHLGSPEFRTLDVAAKSWEQLRAAALAAPGQR